MGCLADRHRSVRLSTHSSCSQLSGCRKLLANIPQPRKNLQKPEENPGVSAQPIPPERTGTRTASRVLIVGTGYLGRRVAAAELSLGNEVWASTRSQARCSELSEQGFRPILLDWNDSRTLRDLPTADRVLVAVSYDRHSGLGRYESQVGGLRRLLRTLTTESCLSTEGHVCYISTTGVYQQTDGRWVDETTPTRPTRSGGRAHLDAENVLRRYLPRSPWSILRLAGIYGPRRVPRVADVISGRPIASPESGYLNLIHVDDAAAAVQAAWRRVSLPPDQQRLFVVADDAPVIRGEFYREIARQCRVDPPRFTRPNPHSPISSRSESNKRVWNRRMKRELLCRLRFPDYRTGLAHVLAND